MKSIYDEIEDCIRMRVPTGYRFKTIAHPKSEDYWIGTCSGEPNVNYNMPSNVWCVIVTKIVPPVPLVKEYTVAELSKALGVTVKVVEESK
jgi:hypothetical protein